MENKSAHLIRIAVIALITFLAYSNSFNSAFHFDDYSSIITHPYIKSMNNIPYFFYYNGSPLISRPVTMATFAVNFAIGGLDPFSYHVMSFFIHLANAILVYILLVLTLKNRVNGYVNISLFAALMFAAHPIQTQAVTYIVQRAEILSSFFYLLSLVMFIKASLKQVEAKVKIKIKSFSTSTLTFYSLSILSSVLAMGSKEIAVTLPVVILLYDFFFLSDGDIKTLSRRWAVHLLFFMTLISLMYFMGGLVKSFVATDAVSLPPTSGIEAETSSISRHEYFLTQFRVIWTYIKLLILPINQNLDYNYGLSRGLLTPLTTLFGGIGIITFFGLAVFFFKRQKVISFFILWFFLILAPTSSVAILPDVIFEHRMYLPSLGYFVIFALGAFKVSEIIFGTERSG
ncbi:MAG: hypothetical protein Q7T83_00725 [Thermodesulfovibrionales bacterium]|nr:hypothetical protein [Thermodesulfovibrionales bacterium]